ncbi:hypothetical protein CHUAL_010695 [Chamberlinius hualienensis]
MMRAIRVSQFGGPEVLKVTSIPLPKIEDDQVLIKVKAIGVNPLETYIRAGIHPVKPELPYTPGGDAAGIIEAVGKQITNFKVGQRVYTIGALGSYAEYTVASRNRVFPLSDKLTFEQGAALGIPYFTAYRALFTKTLSKPGETVLIHGASGGVGLAAIQLAKAHGLTVFATAGTAEGSGLVKHCRADYVFNHREENYVNQLMEASGGRGFDIIIEMLANVNLVTDLSQLAAIKGRIIVIGSRGSIPEFMPRLLMGKELSVIGCSWLLTVESEWVLTSSAINGGIEVGYINPIVGKAYRFEDAAQAHTDIIDSTGAQGKLVLKI